MTCNKVFSDVTLNFKEASSGLLLALAWLEKANPKAKKTINSIFFILRFLIEHITDEGQVNES